MSFRGTVSAVADTPTPTTSRGSANWAPLHGMELSFGRRIHTSIAERHVETTCVLEARHWAERCGELNRKRLPPRHWQGIDCWRDCEKALIYKLVSDMSSDAYARTLHVIITH